jgi:hypothetical protein
VELGGGLVCSLIEHPTIFLVQAGRVLRLSLSLRFILKLNNSINPNLIHLNLG